MKIATASDIHLEFGQLEIENLQKAKVLLLNGDICVSKSLFPVDDHMSKQDGQSKIFHEFFQKCCSEFEHVLYIMGNHEHYHGDFATTANNLKTCLGYLSNLHILDKESITIDDVTFIGSTLWTDMNGEDETTLALIQNSMNDFRLVTNSNEMVSFRAIDPESLGLTYNEMLERFAAGTLEKEAVPYKFHTRPSKFSPKDAVMAHKEALYFIAAEIEANPTGKFVVMGHHAPSRQSTKPRYEHDFHMNGGYSSNLEEFIKERPQIKLWTHGHTHSFHDYVVGETRVLCNPRGYIGYEYDADQFVLTYVDV